MNDRKFALDELSEHTEEWWFPLDSAVLSGDLAVEPPRGTSTRSTVDLVLYIPYIVTDHGALHIEEHDTKTMKAVAA